MEGGGGEGGEEGNADEGSVGGEEAAEGGEREGEESISGEGGGAGKMKRQGGKQRREYKNKEGKRATRSQEDAPC